MERVSKYIGNPESPSPIRLIAKCGDCKWKAELNTTQVDFVEDIEMIRESASCHQEQFNHTVRVFTKR